MLETRGRIRLIVFWALCVSLVFACRPDPLQYDPDSVHLGADGVLYLHSAPAAAIYRFSVAEMRYLPRLQLEPDSLHVAYSAADHVLYVAYADGSLTRIDLTSGVPCRLSCVQWSRNRLRCQEMTVLGFTKTRTSCQPDHVRESHTQS